MARPRHCKRCNKPKTSLNKKPTCNCGRPTKLNIKVVDKLLSILKINGTVEEACRHANIDKTSFYKWYKQNPEFAHDVDSAKDFPFLVARRSIVNKVANDGNLALNFLKAKKPKEFAVEQEPVKIDINLSNEQQSKIDSVLKKLNE